MDSPPLSWLVSFARFWYHFLIGDDWTIAAAVVAALAVSAVLARHGIAAWWLTPVAVLVVIWVDLHRAARTRR